MAGRPPILVRPQGTRLELPLETAADLVGRRGKRESLARQRVIVETAREVTLRFEAAVGGARNGPADR
jgi:hypothetical protein